MTPILLAALMGHVDIVAYLHRQTNLTVRLFAVFITRLYVPLGWELLFTPSDGRIDLTLGLLMWSDIEDHTLLFIN
jgi:hypothetical protein